VEIWWQANRIPRARIVIYDGEPANGKFPVSEADTFVPGAKIVIASGYQSDSVTVHKGVVVRHSVRIQPGVSPQLIVDTASPLLKMTLARHSAVTQQSSDSALIAALVAANGGSVGTNKAGSGEVEAIVQAHASDWDLMLLRAEASGCLVVVDDSAVDIISPTDSEEAVLHVGYDDSIISFDAAVDASGLLANDAVNSRAWSYADQKVTEASAGGTPIETPGNLTAAKLAKVMGVASYVQQTAGPQTEAALTDWSSARLMRAKLSQFVGTVKFQGNAKPKPGAFVKLDNLGTRFNGDVFVSGVRHRMGGGNWHTTLELGMPAERFASRDSSIVEPPAAGLAAPLRGLHTGQVVEVAEDPSGDFRVLVTLPMIDAANGIWARLAQPYASSGFGWSVFPEVGDEVVLSFMNEDPAGAVIIASVYSSQRKPTHVPNKENDVKALTTRSLMEINFNDKDVILKVSTPGGRFVTLDDKEGSITVADAKGNKLVMTDKSVDLISTAKLNIKSTGDMTIESKGNLTVSAAAKCDISAPKVSATGSTNLALSSNAMASLKAATMLEVKGALVKIN
jgi:Rhs element Vgr protein